MQKSTLLIDCIECMNAKDPWMNKIIWFNVLSIHVFILAAKMIIAGCMYIFILKLGIILTF